MAAKMKKIAELVGVSESTVSRVLNNSPLISEKTKQQVLEAARTLNYQTARMNMIGLIEPRITNPLFAEIISTIEARVYEAGYGLLLCDSAYDLVREQEQLDFLLRQEGVQGVILIVIDPLAEHVQRLLAQNFPCVLLGTDPVPGSDQVNVDASIGAYYMTRHLLELGHRRIGLIIGPPWVKASGERLKGYRQALDEFYIPFDLELVAESGMDEYGGASAMEALLARGGEPITGVFAITDLMAIGALRKLRERGKRVPEDISLAGYGDITFASLIQPSLTTVWQPKKELGVLATKFILKQIRTHKERGEGWKEMYPFQSAMYHPYVIKRESTRELK